MLESKRNEHRDPDRGRGVHHISEIVPFVLARIGAAKPQALESHARAEPPYPRVVPVPGVLAEA